MVRGDLRVIGCFDNHGQEVRGIFDRYWGLLLTYPDLQEILSLQLTITFRKGRSLRDQLVSSYYVRQRSSPTWLDNKLNGCFK